MKFEERYRSELEKHVSLDERELRWLSASLRQEMPKKEMLHLSQKQFIRICLVILLLLALLTVVAVAALRLLAPHEVAEVMGNNVLAAVLRETEEDMEPQSVTDGGYTITLLGLAAGTNIRAPEETAVDPTHSYAVVALQRVDGQPVTPEENAGLLYLPLISGYESARIAPFTMTIGRSAFYQDGVCYNLVDMVDLTAFDDHALWLCVLQTPFPTADVLTMDAREGDPVYTDSYTGLRAMFRLPVESGMADPARAAELLRRAGLE